MKIGCFFPGYGNQFVTMAKDIYDESRLVQEYFEEASHCLDLNFVKLCFAASESELAKLPNAYSSIFLVSSAIVALLKSKGLPISIFAGQGVGEYAALHAVHVLTAPDSLYLLNKVARFTEVELAEPVSLKISGISQKLFLQKYTDFLKQFSSLKQGVTLSSHAFIMTGLLPDIEALKLHMQQERRKIKTIKAVVTHELGGLYTPSAEPLVKSLAMYLEKIDIKDPVIDFVRGSDGKIISQGKQIRKYLLEQLVQPIRTDKIMKKFDSVDMIIVPTPGVKWAQQLKELYPQKHIVGIHTYADIEKLVQLYHEAEERDRNYIFSKSIAAPSLSVNPTL